MKLLALASLATASTWALLPLSALATPSSTPRNGTGASQSETIELQPGTPYSGVVSADEIIVPEGVVVRVDGDLELVANNRLIVDGTIWVDDVIAMEGLNAPNLTLTSSDLLTVRGCVRGGTGMCLSSIPFHLAAGVQGGKGTDLRLSAPDLLITGMVSAGKGGQGGPGARGGQGGSVDVVGHHVTDRHALTEDDIAFIRNKLTLTNGRAGDGGRGWGPFKNGGDGGPPGHIALHEHPDPAEWGLPESSGSSDGFMFALTGIFPALCTQGEDAIDSSKIEGAPGSDGAPGQDGAIFSPDGGVGGHGQPGADVTGYTPQAGQPGKPCCKANEQGPGGPGGKGGDAGDVVGGKGGDGGPGGNAYRPAPGFPYWGNGGKGGNAGKSGDAIGHVGGQGGKGGDGVPPGSGGDYGKKASVVKGGAPGERGVGGIGHVNGALGDWGAPGSVAPGGDGPWGNHGDYCEEQ